VKRREFITLPAKSLGGLLVYTLAGKPALLHAEETSITVGLRFFSRSEARAVAAVCERIMPSDETGPGAKEAGVVIYIDRQLAGPYGTDRYRYTRGPFVEAGPEYGYQGRASPQEIYRDGLRRLGSGFADLETERQDELLRAIERSLFFRMLRMHTIEGMFSDPLHGGNAGMIGWQLIGFPGPRMDYDYRDKIDETAGRAWRPKPADLQGMVGHAVEGWEDERG
jgi:gluconate 2-dehydrogenase gamma chain